MNFAFPESDAGVWAIRDIDIYDIERQFNIRFPQLLRDYYLQHNGSPICDCELKLGENWYVVFEVIALKFGPLSFEKLKERIKEDDTIPRSFYPIAIDPGEGIFYWDANNAGIWYTPSQDGTPPKRLFKNIEGFFEAMNTAAIHGEYRREENMNNMDYLPLGSVVLLKNGAHKVIIVGRGLNVENDGQTYYFDYGGALYPEGLVGDQLAYFNHDGIARVFFEGYRDDDNDIMNDRLNEYVQNNPDLKRAKL